MLQCRLGYDLQALTPSNMEPRLDVNRQDPGQTEALPLPKGGGLLDHHNSRGNSRRTRNCMGIVGIAGAKTSSHSLDNFGYWYRVFLSFMLTKGKYSRKVRWAYISVTNNVVHCSFQGNGQFDL